MSFTINSSNTAADIAEFLESYRFGRKMIEINKYEKEYFGGRDNPDAGWAVGEDDEAYIKAKMFEVKRFVTSLPPDDRKLFLFYHYIRCESVERCAELLRISRRSAYRLKRRALEYAAIKYRSFSKKEYEQ
jgi:DNA-directed RNA polymerase specialized sigma24 family protein